MKSNKVFSVSTPLILIAGAFFASRHTDPSRSPASIASEATLSPSIANFSALKAKVAPPPIDANQLAVLETDFDAVFKEKGDPKVAAKLAPKTLIEKRLCRLIEGVRLAKLIPKESRKLLADSYLSDFIQNRDETISDAKAILTNLNSTEFAEERLGVYSVLTELPDIQGEMRTLSMNELTALPPPARPELAGQQGVTQEAQNQALSWSASQMLPLVAYGFYLHSTIGDPDEALIGTVAAIQSQQDSGIRKSIATGFVSTYPDLKPQLYQQLAQAQIQVPDVQPQAPQHPGLTVSQASSASSPE